MEGEPKGEHESTAEDLIEAAKDFLTQEDVEDLAGLDFDETLDNLVIILELQGIDWEKLFKDQGISQ